jgi:hypothetical protein
MSMRMFVGDDGREWQAFDVVPRENERRRYDRRSTPADGVDSERRSAPDESVENDRRERDRRLSVGRTSLPTHSSAGWLCFESGVERRRLRPIPEDWNRCDEAVLRNYCRDAAPVQAPRSAANKNAAVNPRR